MAKKKKKMLAPIARESKKAVEAMSPALQKLYHSTLSKLNKLASHEILTRYAIGICFDNALGDKRKYGENVANLLSAAFGVSEATIYSYRKIAATWDADEIKELVTAKSPTGTSITFSHISALALVDKVSQRQKLLKQFRTNGLTVREMVSEGRLLAGSSDATAGAGPPRLTGPRSPAAGVKKIVDLAGQFNKLGSQLDETVFQKLGEDPGKWAKPELLEDIMTAEQELAAMLTDAESNVRKLAAARDAVRRVIVAGEANTVDAVPTRNGNGTPAGESTTEPSRTPAKQKRPTKKVRRRNRLSTSA
jgi:hypothetical protein